MLSCELAIDTKIKYFSFLNQKLGHVSMESLRKESQFICCATLKRGLITQHECMPVEGMQTSSYPLTHTGIALYWEKLWNASKDVK